MDRNLLSGGVDGGARRINTGSIDVIRWLLVEILIVGSKWGACSYLCEKKFEHSRYIELQVCSGLRHRELLEIIEEMRFVATGLDCVPGTRFLLKAYAETLHFRTDSRLYSCKRFLEEDCTTSELKEPGLEY